MDQDVAVVSPQPQRPREPGSQPIPGYRLLEPLGKGGFGEVWKCEAPGGLFKAVKFVPCPDEQSGPANQERQALQLVKAIRHPFILSLERVEIVEGMLVIVMELADKSLYSLLGDYQARNLPGIPREELLGYLLEVAEALDWMNFGHGLQHLDIKPHNLFLVSNHVKVADFGLVDRLTDVAKTHPTQRQGGVTPLYAAPELLRGTVSRHCDQYSLAIVYQQLLTGTVPFWCQNLYQMMMLHLSGEPNLTPLPKDDRPIVARALSKTPDDRFPSCLDFLQALICSDSSGKTPLPRRAATVRKILSSLQQPPEPPPALPRPDDTESEPSTDSLRPAPGAYATVPMPAEDKEDKTTAVGTVAASPQAIPSSQHPSPEQIGTQGMTIPRPGLSPTCVSLPGYRFLACLNQTPLGDIWKVEDEKGRVRRALCLHNFVEQDPALIERLQGLNHPVLPRVEMAWSPSGRLVLMTEDFEQTLRDRLEACQKQGLPGIPREELLGYLRMAAEAIDALYQQHSIPHLGLNPRVLMLRDERVWMLDYGLIPLVWLPTGQTGSTLNARYAAPELFEKADLTGIPPGEATRAALLGRAGSTADQFSLALIYAEMLNGITPHLPRLASPRRPGKGPKRRGGRSDSGLVPLRGQARLDLDLLPTCDHAILLKALHDDPQQRFPSCTALVDALERAISGTARRAALYHRLPAVIPFASLQGEPPAKGLVLPPLPQLIRTLVMPNVSSAMPPRTIIGSQNTRYVLQSDGVWETKCPVQVFSGALPIKVEGFRTEWHARIVQQKNDHFLLHFDVPLPPRPSDRDKPVQATVAFELEVQTVPVSAKYYAEARMRVFTAAGDRDRTAQILLELAPCLFDSMRSYLQAVPEQRSADRWPCPHPLHVYPVRPDLELDEILDGISRNISLTGISFRVPQAPRVEQAYLHWHRSPTLSPYAVLARIIRVQTMVGGGFEVGAIFPQAT